MHESDDVQAFGRGDGAYFAELVRRLSPRLLFVARSFTDDAEHAEDLVQSTWLRVLEKRGDYRGDGALATWIQGVCRHVCLNDARARRSRARMRERAASAEVRPGVASAPPHDPARRLDRQDRLRQVERALVELTDREREVFTMTYGEGLTSPQIAEALGSSESTVRVHLANARKKIRQEVEAT